MKIEFAHTVEDTLEAADASAANWKKQRREWRRSDPGFRRNFCSAILTVALLLGGLLMILAASISLSVSHHLAWLLPGCISGCFTLLILRLLVRRKSHKRKQFAADERNLAQSRFELKEEGFEMDCPTWRCRVSWSAVKSFFESESLLLLVDNTPNTFIVPKRAFATQEQLDTFRTYVQSNVTGA